MRNTYIAVGVMSALVLAAIIYGFFAMGSPWAVRGYKFDDTRMSNFSSISSAVQTFYYSKYQLPKDLGALASSSYGYYVAGGALKDPDTKQPYDYKLVDQTNYQLCATFYATSEEENNRNSNSYIYYDSATQKTHGKGYDCITYTVSGNTTYPVLPTSYYGSLSGSSTTSTYNTY